MLVRRLRLWTGLILAVYVVIHFANHILGLLSLEAMEGLRRIVTRIWSHPLGMAALYGALALHFLVALWSLYRRSNLRLKSWEAAQLLSGILIPPLLAGHVIGTRGNDLLFDIHLGYPEVVTALWLTPRYGVQQALLLLIVWVHLMIGLHFWLRLKPWYSKVVPLLYPLVVLLPVLALLGFVRAGLTVQALAAEPGWVEQLFAELAALDPEQRALFARLEPTALAVVAGLLALALLARRVRRFHHRRYGVFHLTYPSGKTIEAPVGTTMLEAVRAAGMPHASVCGGRGRCTTCRVRVGPGKEALAPPNEVEQKALARIEAPPGVRLACQVRPRGDVAITPLLLATASPEAAWYPGGFQGREQPIAVLFLDLRDSTGLAERLLPYDVVFILNQFFGEMTAALRTTGGHYTHFIGDGLMALYGLESDLETGCRQAIAGAVEMLRRLQMLNRSLEPELGQSLRMGIGIHSGEAIVGDMGPPEAPCFTAIGDNVNIAARLEALCKAYDCELVVSAITARRAGIDLSAFPKHKTKVRGRSEPLLVYAITEAILKSELEPVS